MKFKKIVKKGRMHSNDAAEGWFGIKDAKFIYHGDWNDPEVEYKGVSLNYWDIESGLLEVYRNEHPEDKNDKGFDKWMADHPEEIRSELELLYDAEMEYRANNPEEQYDESWVGDKAKQQVDEYIKSLSQDQIQTLTLRCSELLDYWNEPQGSDTILRARETMNNDERFLKFLRKTVPLKETTSDIQSRIARLQRELDSEEDSLEYADGGAYSQSRDRIADLKSQIAKLKKELGGETTLANEMTYDESWVGDKAKAGWNKVKSGAKAVKSGAKKLAKAVGDVFKGPFRKGDHIMMKGEDGEQFKGTITGWDLDKKTYQVMLGNSVSEGSQEDALAMPNRIQEIETQLQNNTQRLYNMLADEYLDNDKMFDELLEERDALVEELCGCRGLVKEETYEDKVHREWLDAVEKHKAERQKIKDRIRDIVGDEKAEDVFRYWDKIQSSFNMRWKERDGFSGTDKEHLARLSKILGPEGKDIVDAIDAQFKRQSKELSDYYDTHSFTGD